MAGTYTPAQAINLVQQFVSGIPLAGNEANICDMVYSMMWVYYPWSWTVTSITPITLIDGVQDYTLTNTDILRPLKFRLARIDTNPREVREMSALADLPVELTRRGGIETNTNYSYFAGTNTLRLMYAASIGAGQSVQIQGEYIKQPTRITDSNLTTPFAFPDYYFNVFVEGIKWKIYQLSDDPRAGGIQMSKNGTFEQVFTGQLAVFMQQLNYMSRTEDLASGDQFQFPESGLGGGHNFWPGLYGL